MACYYDGLWCASSELLYHSHYFSFGDQVSINKINSSKHTEGFEKVISIGSPALDQIRKSESSGNSYILYGSSKYITYGAGFVPRYTDEVLRKNQTILLGFFEKYLNTTVIWKLNQNRLSEQPFVTVKNVKVIRDEIKFSDLISDAEIIILDRPSTTQTIQFPIFK